MPELLQKYQEITVQEREKIGILKLLKRKQTQNYCTN